MNKKESVNFICILPFMVDELRLTGNDLIAYALIYGFSQDGKSLYRGGVEYLSRRLGITKRASISLLKRLSDAGHIVMVCSGRRNYYYCSILNLGEDTSPKKVKKLHNNDEECSPKKVKKVHLTGEETSPRNKYSNKEENKICLLSDKVDRDDHKGPVSIKSAIYAYFFIHSAADPHSETERFYSYYITKKLSRQKILEKLSLWDFSKRKQNPQRYSPRFATFWANLCNYMPEELLAVACSDKVREYVSKRIVYFPKPIEDWLCEPENVDFLNDGRKFRHDNDYKFYCI